MVETVLKSVICHIFKTGLVNWQRRAQRSDFWFNPVIHDVLQLIYSSPLSLHDLSLSTSFYLNQSHHLSIFMNLSAYVRTIWFWTHWSGTPLRNSPFNDDNRIMFPLPSCSVPHASKMCSTYDVQNVRCLQHEPQLATVPSVTDTYKAHRVNFVQY